MRVEDVKSVYKISDDIKGLYKILNDLSWAVGSYNKFVGNPRTQVCEYAPDPSIPEELNVRYLIKEFEIEVNKLKVIIINDLVEDMEESFPESINDLTLPEKFEFEGLEDITEDELLKLNFLRLTAKEEVFNSYKEELEEKYNG